MTNDNNLEELLHGVEASGLWVQLQHDPGEE